MESIKSYRDLIVWQKSMDLVTEVYRITKTFPKEELYVLVPQMRRAAISIPSNIAEGYTRKSKKEYIQFVQTAFGSATELETQMLIAQKLDYLSKIDSNKLFADVQEVLRMLNGLLKSLKFPSR